MSKQLSSRLTPREEQVLAFAKRGLASKAIAHGLGLAEGTVKMHLHHIYGKLGVRNRSALIIALRNPKH